MYSNFYMFFLWSHSYLSLAPFWKCNNLNLNIKCIVINSSWFNKMKFLLTLSLFLHFNDTGQIGVCFWWSNLKCCIFNKFAAHVRFSLLELEIQTMTWMILTFFQMTSFKKVLKKKRFQQRAFFFNSVFEAIKAVVSCIKSFGYFL